ncbi:MAG: dihydroorotate dehydrogenase [Candidatus Omnitrophota bacterium]
MKNSSLSVKIGKLKLKNPVLVASGTFGYAEEFKDLLNLSAIAAIITKTITLKPRKGNPPPRTSETPAGMLNSIGLENPGLEKFIEEKIPVLKKIGTPIIVSIASEDDPEEFLALARRLDKIKEVAAIELNISCPNIKRVRSPQSAVHSQTMISQDAKATYDLVKKVRACTRKTLITKLSPNVISIAEIALAAKSAGSDAVSLINTITAMDIDTDSRRPALAAITGGLSGPAIRPIALRMVWEVYQKVKIPVIGMGGIVDTNSALQFFIAGATAICVGTGNFINPRVSLEIIEGLKKYLKENKISSINKLIGSLKCQV